MSEDRRRPQDDRRWAGVCLNLGLAGSVDVWFTQVRPVWRRCALYTDRIQGHRHLRPESQQHIALAQYDAEYLQTGVLGPSHLE